MIIIYDSCDVKVLVGQNGLVQFEIRKLAIKDYNNIVELWKSTGLPFKPNGRDSRVSIQGQMEKFPELFLGTFYGEKLVGVVIGSYDYRMKGWINRLAVDPKFRNKGVASQLVNVLEGALERMGATILCALIDSYNEESLDLFKKLGYTVYDDVFYVTKRRNRDV